jgi:hypothetical protein
MAAIWDDGTTASSDGQYFRAAGRAGACGAVNAKYGIDRGFVFYTQVSGRYSPFHTQVIAATVNEAPYVLDGRLHHVHQTVLRIREHYTDPAGATDPLHRAQERDEASRASAPLPKRPIRRMSRPWRPHGRRFPPKDAPSRTGSRALRSALNRRVAGSIHANARKPRAAKSTMRRFLRTLIASSKPTLATRRKTPLRWGWSIAR